MFGDGLQTRSFCYVDDMVDGMMRVMSLPREFTGPINLGSTHEVSMRQLAEQVIALTGSHSRMIRDNVSPISRWHRT